MQRGHTLFQTLLALVIGSMVALMCFRQFAMLDTGLRANTNAAENTTRAHTAVATLADHLRGAAVCGSGVTGILNSGLQAASATSVTYYTDSACTKVRYYWSGTNLLREENGTSQTVVQGVTACTFTYYKATNYNVAWSATTNASAPTNAELPQVCGVKIDLTVNRNGVSSRIVTLVRLRNLPKKTGLDGIS